MVNNISDVNKTVEFIRELLPPLNKWEHIVECCHELNVPLIRVEAAQLLRVLVMAMRPSRILEIGMGIGYSAHVLLDCAPSNCKLYTIEHNEVFIAKAKEILVSSSIRDRVAILAGDAREIVPNIEGVFDIIFMDGPKSCYIDFLPYCIDLLRSGGMLVCDNVLFMGNISGEKDVKQSTLIRKLREFLREINKPPLESSVLNVADGISISIKQ